MAKTIRKLRWQAFCLLLGMGYVLVSLQRNIVSSDWGYDLGIYIGFLIIIAYIVTMAFAIPKFETIIIREVHSTTSRYKTAAHAFAMIALKRILFGVNFYTMAVLATFLTGSMSLTPLFYLGGVTLGVLYWPRQSQYDAFLEKVRQT